MGLAQEHRENEALIKQSSLSSTLLCNHWYSENHLASLQHVIETGILFGAVDGQISSATPQNYAKAALHVLNATEYTNRTYELADLR